MSITRVDIKESAFTSDLSELKDLQLDNRGIVDLGCIGEVTGLTSLNLAFNNLASLQGLAPLVELQCLNVSHNSLSHLSLKGLAALTQLNAAHNKLTSLRGLSACPALQDLFLQHNKLPATELQHLTALKSLSRLSLMKNPAAAELPAMGYRQLVAGLCPTVQMLDGAPVTQAERDAGGAAAQHYQLAHAAPPSSLLLLPTAPASSTLPGPLPQAGRGSNTGPRTPGGQGAPWRQRRSAPASPAGRAGVPGAQAGSPGGLAGRVGGGSVLQGPGSVLQRAASSSHLGAELLAGLEQSPDQGSGTSLAPNDSHTPTAGRRARPPLYRTPPKLKQLPVDSQFAAVLAALPVFDTAQLPDKEKYSPSHLAASQPRKKAVPCQAPADAGVVEQEIRYGLGNRCVAASVKRDGSASALWPNAELAVTVDADWKGGGAEPTHRMYAAYRNSSNVAVSWDASGGFVQYPSGNICITYSASSGAGTCYSPSGQVLLKWCDPPGQPHDGMPTWSASTAPASASAPLAGAQGSDAAAVSGMAMGNQALARPTSRDNGTSATAAVMAGMQDAMATAQAAMASARELLSRGQMGVSQPPSSAGLPQLQRTTSSSATPPASALPAAAAAPTGGFVMQPDDTSQAAMLAPSEQAGSEEPGPPPVDMALDAHFGVRWDRAHAQLQLWMSCEGVRFCFVCGHNQPGNTWGGATTGGHAHASRDRTSRSNPQAADAELPGSADGRVPVAIAGPAGVGPSRPPAFLQQLSEGSSAGAMRATMVKDLQMSAGGLAQSRTTAGIHESPASLTCAGGIDSLAGLTAALHAFQERMQLISSTPRSD